MVEEIKFIPVPDKDPDNREVPLTCDVQMSEHNPVGPFPSGEYVYQELRLGNSGLWFQKKDN
jgi:hypothetical protein